MTYENRKPFYKKSSWNKKETPTYKEKRGWLKPLMTEEQKSSSRVEELAYDFACRIVRLYQYGTGTRELENEGNREKLGTRELGNEGNREKPGTRELGNEGNREKLGTRELGNEGNREKLGTRELGNEGNRESLSPLIPKSHYPSLVPLIPKPLILQILRSGTSIAANLNEAKHPQSDADYLSKASIALKEARETEFWLNLLHDNGYLDENQFCSLNHDLDRILRILVTVTTKVRERLRQN